MDGTAAPVGVGPQLVHRPDQARCPVGDDEERAAETAPDETASEVRPVLRPLPLSEADVEQHPLAVSGEAPGDEDALLGAVGPDRQVDGIEEQAEQADVGEAPGPEGPVPVTQLSADRAHRRLADRTQARLPG